MHTRSILALILFASAATACTSEESGRTPANLSDDGGVCVPQHTLPVNITSGAESTVAMLTLRTSETMIEVTVVPETGFALGGTWVVIGSGGTFHSFVENPTPWVDGYRERIEFDIPLSELGFACGTMFKLIVQLKVQDESGAVHFASAVGEFRLEPPTDGWKDFYVVCCEEDGQEGCTLTQGFWKNHPEAWPVAALTLGATSYTQEELIAILMTPPGGDASLILAHQLIAAMLNVENGATTSDAIADAQAWMSAHAAALPAGVHASTDAGADAVAIADRLAAFNEGIDGPGHCDDE